MKHVIAVNGPVAVGKTTFSNLLKTIIDKAEGSESSEVVPLDSYMMDRQKLHQSNVPNGYDDNNWNLTLAREHIQNMILHNSEISVKEYSHKSGRHLSAMKKVKPMKYLILDGLISYSQVFEEYVNAKVFICGKNVRSEQNPRIQVAYHERNYTLKDAISKSEREIKDYCHYLLPKRGGADAWLVMKDNTWNYDIHFDYPEIFA